MQTCPECGRASPTEARFCLACGAALRAPPAESRRLVTVLFCDLAGSTALGERHDAEQLRRVLERYAATARTVIERHGGTVEKFIGDAVMAVFGVPVVHEDDALRAARAALQLRAALTQLNEELERELGVTIRTRIGVNSGEVLAGDPGGGDAFVAGDAVNVAKRLEESAGPGEILVGTETYRLARDALQAELLPPIPAKGKGGPLTAYRLRGVAAGALPRARRLDSPLVGRARELGLLRAAFDQAAAERTCRVVTLVGPAGVGKTRLATEVTRGLGRRATVLTGTCPTYGEGITFWPVAEVVRQAAGLTGAESPAAARARVAAAAGEEGELVAERLAPLLGMAGADASATDIFWALRRLLEAQARRRPLVLVFEDVHWGEPTFLDLVEHLPDWSREAPILVLCLARPELFDVRPGWTAAQPAAVTLLLEPLAPDETETLIRNIAGDVGAEVARRVLAAAEGNPLFVEELLASLLDDGIELSSLPPTIHVLLAARLDRLAPDERRTLDCAAVEGNEFHAGAVAALAGRPVGQALFALVRKGLVRPHRAALAGQDGFRFWHILLRDAAYEALPKRRRGELHERYAAWLEASAGDQALELEELLGYHLEQAFRYRTELGPLDETAAALGARAARRLASAGRRALARNDVGAASKLLRRALALRPQGAPAIALRLDLSEALLFAGEFAAAEEQASEAEAQAAATGDRCGELRARLMTLRIATMAATETGREGAPSDALAALARQAIPVLQQAGDDAALTDAWAAIAWTELFRGRFGAMLEAIDEGLEHAERAGRTHWSRELLGWRSTALYGGPTPVEEALRWHEEQRTRHPLGLWYCAVLEAMRGGFAEARSLIAAGDRSAEELGQALLGAAGGIAAWEVEMLADEAVTAEACARRSCRLLEQVGDRAMRSTACGQLAESLYRLDRLDEARRWTEMAERLGTRDDVASQVLWRQVRAKILARQGEPDAERLAHEAVALAEQADAPNWQGHARADLAEVLALAGRDEEAAAELTAAIALYERKGNAVAAAGARRRLAELRPAPTVSW